MSKNNFGGRLIAFFSALLVTGLIALGINYLALPAMTFQSSGFWWFWLVIGIIAALVYFAANGIVNSVKYDEGGHIPGFVVGGAAVVWLIVFIVTAIAGSSMTNAIKYSNIITVEEGNFKEDIAEIDINDNERYRNET